MTADYQTQHLDQGVGGEYATVPKCKAELSARTVSAGMTKTRRAVVAPTPRSVSKGLQAPE